MSWIPTPTTATTPRSAPIKPGPTKLGFSKRIIPTLTKLGIQWSVIGNNHFSRTLKDYPFDAFYPNLNTLVSPPDRADLRNTRQVGEWVNQQMAHEQQVIRNKFPFASTPHWIRHVDPESGDVTRIAGIPVDQAGSWLEGWEGAIGVDALKPFESLEPRQFFVIAHDGDNSPGRAGSRDTWVNGYRVTCANRPQSRSGWTGIQITGSRPAIWTRQ